jgi:hypothetical protein
MEFGAFLSTLEENKELASHAFGSITLLPIGFTQQTLS